MILEDIMDQIGQRLDSIDGLRTAAYEADDVQVPAAIVSLPPNITYSETYNRGMDSITLIVTILVSLANARIRRDQIAVYADGVGPKSVKAVLESGSYTAFDTIFISTAQFMVVDIAKLSYLSVVFTANVTGRGN